MDSSPGGPSSTPESQSVTGASQKVQIGVGVSVSVAGAAAGLLVLLLMLKRRRDNKKKQPVSDETPMTDKNDEGTYGNIPAADKKGNYSNITSASDGKYSNLNSMQSDDGIAAPTAIQPSEIDKRMHIPYKSLVFTKEIGAGSYGKVYLG